MRYFLNRGRKQGVYVRAYLRYRHGQLEHVCAHHRSYPKR